MSHRIPIFPRFPTGISTAALAAVLLAAGCGGSERMYRAIPTQACLAQHDLASSHTDGDIFVLDAVNGGYEVKVGRTVANVSFYRNGTDARQRIKGYELWGFSPGSKLYVKGNALVAWDDTPTGSERASVDGCLS